MRNSKEHLRGETKEKEINTIRVGEETFLIRQIKLNRTN